MADAALARPTLQEWQVVSIAGRSKAAARAGGHVIAVHQGEPYMYGGRDALGAQVSHLLRLRRAGPNRWSRLPCCTACGRQCAWPGHGLQGPAVDD